MPTGFEWLAMALGVAGCMVSVSGRVDMPRSREIVRLARQALSPAARFHMVRVWPHNQYLATCSLLPSRPVRRVRAGRSTASFSTEGHRAVRSSINVMHEFARKNAVQHAPWQRFIDFRTALWVSVASMLKARSRTRCTNHPGTQSRCRSVNGTRWNPSAESSTAPASTGNNKFAALTRSARRPPD